MPTYVYRGLQTGTTFEVQQRITEDALTSHPETGEPVVRVIQPVGIAFKGSGFYRNDSRASGSGGSRSESKPEGSSESKSESKAESKADSKPAAKIDSKPAAAAD